jgi:hypothetical protein
MVMPHPGFPDWHFGGAVQMAGAIGFMPIAGGAFVMLHER